MLPSLIPLGRLYFVDSQSLLKGVGPLQTEQWRRPENNSDMGIMRDYVQVLLMNPGRYGFKSDLDLTASGDTPGTEPASIEAAKAITGIELKSHFSDPSGTIFSLAINFSTSKKGWKRGGPTLFCILAVSILSIPL